MASAARAGPPRPSRIRPITRLRRQAVKVPALGAAARSACPVSLRHLIVALGPAIA
jgi:hypothetical protein